MPPAAAMIIKPALRDYLPATYIKLSILLNCPLTWPTPIRLRRTYPKVVPQTPKGRGWRGFPLSSGGKSPVKPAMQSPQSKGAVKKCKSFFHSPYFISCRRQHAFGNPPSPLRGPLPHDKQGGAREYIGARHPPLKEALIKSLSAFILGFLCNARNGTTRIASYLRSPMTKQCIKILIKADSMN